MDYTAYDEQKSANGGFATWVWLGTGTYLFSTSENGPGLFSWQAAVFLLVGMFIAAIFIGGILYFVQRVLAKVIVSKIRERQISRQDIAKIKAISGINFILSIVLAIAATFISFNFLFG